MGTLLDDTALVKNIDHVGLLDGAKSVGHRDRCATFGGRVESGLNDLFGFRIECRGRFVQQATNSSGHGLSIKSGVSPLWRRERKERGGDLQDLWVSDECSCNGDSLLLTTAEHGAFATGSCSQTVSATTRLASDRFTVGM